MAKYYTIKNYRIFGMLIPNLDPTTITMELFYMACYNKHRKYDTLSYTTWAQSYTTTWAQSYTTRNQSHSPVTN